MRPVWEEEWELNDYGGLNVWVNGEPGNSTHVAIFDDEPRGLLAAQAPAMARWVLQWHDKLSSADPRRIDAERVLRAAGVLP